LATNVEMGVEIVEEESEAKQIPRAIRTYGESRWRFSKKQGS
jgi:hypothetical protein